MNETKKTGPAGRTFYEKTILVFAFFLSAAVFMLFLTACGNGLFGGTAYGTVRIALGGTADSRNAETDPAEPRAVPSTVASFLLIVEGDGMDTIEQTFTGAEIELDVPAGPDRTFTLTAFAADGLKLYSGSATANVQGGGDVTITIILKLLSGDAFITSFDLLINGEENDGTYGIVNNELGAVLGIVPVGTSLTELIPVAEVSEGAAVDFGGGATVDFSGGASITGTVTAANGTTKEYTVRITGDKLIVLDAVYHGLGGRIVQLNNMQADGWLERNGPVLGKGSTDEFRPYDIDYDIYGHIYIANNVSTGGILKLDNFTDTSPEWLFPGVTIAAIGIDRAKSLIYYIANTGGSNYELRRCDYEGQNSLAYSGFPFVHTGLYPALTVDDEGFVYYTRRLDASNHFIVKLDPAGTGTILIDKPLTTNDPWDVLYRDDILYVSYAVNAGLGDKIVSFNTGLSQLAEEMPIDPSGSPDDLARPTRFIAVLNRKFYITDDSYEEENQYDRILAFNALSGGIDESMSATAGVGKGGDTFKFFANGMC